VGGQHLIVDLAALQELGQRMAHQFADAQLPLRGTRAFAGMALAMAFKTRWKKGRSAASRPPHN
jgi:hypothetical protein